MVQLKHPIATLPTERLPTRLCGDCLSKHGWCFLVEGITKEIWHLLTVALLDSWLRHHGLCYFWWNHHLGDMILFLEHMVCGDVVGWEPSAAGCAWCLRWCFRPWQQWWALLECRQRHTSSVGHPIGTESGTCPLVFRYVLSLVSTRLSNMLVEGTTDAAKRSASWWSCGEVEVARSWVWLMMHDDITFVDVVLFRLHSVFSTFWCFCMFYSALDLV